MTLDTNFNFDEFDKLELNKQPKNPSPKSEKVAPKEFTKEEAKEILKKNVEYVKNIFGEDNE